MGILIFLVPCWQFVFLLDDKADVPGPAFVAEQMSRLRPGMEEAEVAKILRLDKQLGVLDATAHSVTWHHIIHPDHVLSLYYSYDSEERKAVLIEAVLKKGSKVLVRVPARKAESKDKSKACDKN